MVFAQQAPQLGKDPVKKVVQAMTLHEKAQMVVGLGRVFHIPKGVKVPERFRHMKQDPDAAKYPEKVPGAAGRTHPIPRLGIPSITVSDGPAGVRIPPIRDHDSSRTYYATGFPVATLLASTFDTSVVHNAGVAFGSEVHDFGIDIILAPAMNIHRNPLNGRNVEWCRNITQTF
jgi:beta-glucosidase